jgi:hypothetical protein
MTKKIANYVLSSSGMEFGFFLIIFKKSPPPHPPASHPYPKKDHST